MAQTKFLLQCKHDEHIFEIAGDHALGFAKCPLCSGSDFIVMKYEGGKPKYSQESPYIEEMITNKVLFEENVDGDWIRVIQHSNNMRSLKINEVGYSCIYTHSNNKYEPANRGVQELIESVSVQTELKTFCLLGVGGGTLLRYLLRNHQSMSLIDAVEINPLFISLCKQYFIGDLLKLKNINLNIVEGDAFNFIKSTMNQYDFIYVDVYIKDIIPSSTHQEEFVRDIKECLSDNGVVAFNMTFSDNGNALIGIGTRYFSSCIQLNGPADEEKYIIMTNRTLH